MEKNADMAILVVSCDAYVDVAEYFFHFIINIGLILLFLFTL